MTAARGPTLTATPAASTDWRLARRVMRPQLALPQLRRYSVQSIVKRRLQAVDLPDYGRLGSLVVRLAARHDDIVRAQKLRYRVFYEEMNATAAPESLWRRRDIDRLDKVCDHLLVIDEADPYRPIVAGTYRFLLEPVARKLGVRLYTQGEFDVAALIERRSELVFMELGRSCVAAAYRNRRTLAMLWHGLWAYVRDQHVDVMIGCASLNGDDPARHGAALRFLHDHYAAPPEWQAVALPHRRVPLDCYADRSVDPVSALQRLPPLIKGYLRLGAYVGDGAVVDPQFRTTDVCIILPVSRIDPRYFQHFGAPHERGSRLTARS